MDYQNPGLLVRGGEERIAGVLALLNERFLTHIDLAHPDLFLRTYPHLGIDEVREIIDRAALRGLSGRRYFVLAFDAINRNAEHALLKTLEEPLAGAYFVLITPEPEMLLPTLRSRLFYERENATAGEGSQARAFVKASPAERLELLKPYYEKDEEGGRKKSSALSFLASLEPLVASSPGALRAVYEARKYLSDQGASLKLLLERMALLLPRM